MNVRSPALSTAWFADLKRRIDWAKLGKWLSVILLAAAGYLIATRAKDVDWQAVWGVIQRYSALELLIAMIRATSAPLTPSFWYSRKRMPAAPMMEPSVRLKA